MNRMRSLSLGLIIVMLLSAIIVTSLVFRADRANVSSGGTTVVVSTDADGDGLPNDIDQCPFQVGLGDGCPATAAVLLVPSYTPFPTLTPQPTLLSIPTTIAQIPTNDFDLTSTALAQAQLPNYEQTATAHVSTPVASIAVTDDPTSGENPDNPIEIETEVAVVPATDADELGYGQERLYAPSELEYGTVGVVRLEVELYPIAPTPTYRPPLQATPTLAANVTRPPTSTPLPLVASANLEVRSVFQARLTGVDADKFEIVAREPRNEIRAPAHGSVSWWEWHIRALPSALPNRDYSLYVIVFYQTQTESGEVVETTRGERLDFQLRVVWDTVIDTDMSAPPSLPLVLTYAGLALLALILGVVIWRQRYRPLASSPVLLPRLITSQPSIPFAQVMCFVSYARHDEEFVVKFTRRLREEGVNVWRDRDDIPAGASWDDEIDSALQRCTHVLFVASTASVKSDNVGDELSAAISYGKLIVPLLLEDCQLPFRIRRNQWVDFRGDFEAAIAKLLKDLGAK